MEFCNKETRQLLMATARNAGTEGRFSVPVVHQLTKELLSLFLPGRFSALLIPNDDDIEKILKHFHDLLTTIVDDSDSIVHTFCEKFPKILQDLAADIEASFLGDPAAKSHEEVLSSYPSILAVATYRLAHELELLSVPLVPRIMSEWSHSQSGIDIHPGATIAAGFFVDHGTGVVIGETSIIEKGVKLYQGVTLGAKNFPSDEFGNPLKGIHRHPKVEKNVVIYANTTILGGDTVIGEGSEVGAGLFITSSIPPNSLVTGMGSERESGLCYRIRPKTDGVIC